MAPGEIQSKERFRPGGLGIGMDTGKLEEPAR